MRSLFYKKGIIVGPDKGYAKDYKVENEFALSYANGCITLFPSYLNSSSYKLRSSDEARTAILLTSNSYVAYSETISGQRSTVIYDVKQKETFSQYPEIGYVQKLSLKEQICLSQDDPDMEDAQVRVYDYAKSRILWQDSLKNRGDIHIPKLRHDYIVACTYGERQLFALDTLTGRELWRHDYTEFGRYDDGFQRTLRGRIFDFKFWQDSVIVCTSGCYLMRVDLATGRTHWLLQLADPYGIFVIDGDVIHLSQFRRYYLVNAHTGKVIAEHDITTLEWPQNKYGSILGISGHSVDEEFIYITAQSAQKVLIIDKQQWSMAQILDISEGKGSPQASSPLLAGNKLCQVDGQSDLHVFERVG